jgi:hypothetical protein
MKMAGLGELTQEEETNLLLNQLFMQDLTAPAPTVSTSSDLTSQSWFWPAVIGGGILLFMSMGKATRRRRR